jgi:hypothetical protein
VLVKLPKRHLAKMSLLCLHVILLLVTVLFIDFSICLIDDEDYVEDHRGYMAFMSGSGDGGEEMPNGRYLLSFYS